MEYLIITICCFVVLLFGGLSIAKGSKEGDLYGIWIGVFAFTAAATVFTVTSRNHFREPIVSQEFLQRLVVVLELVADVCTNPFV